LLFGLNSFQNSDVTGNRGNWFRLYPALLLFKIFIQQNFAIAITLTIICNVIVGMDFPNYPFLNFMYHWLCEPSVFQLTPGFLLFVAYSRTTVVLYHARGLCMRSDFHETERAAD